MPKSIGTCYVTELRRATAAVSAIALLSGSRLAFSASNGKIYAYAYKAGGE